MKRRLVIFAILAVLAGLVVRFAITLEADEISRGRYLVQIGGCNDCHTAGYALSEGRVLEEQWLTGDTVGWRGPWGTTYASNLRLVLRGYTEETWVQFAKNLKTRPPMPWYLLQQMSEEDLRAVYKYIHELGPAGGPAPPYLPPGQQPKPPFFDFVMQ